MKPEKQKQPTNQRKAPKHPKHIPQRQQTPKKFCPGRKPEITLKRPKHRAHTEDLKTFKSQSDAHAYFHIGRIQVLATNTDAVNEKCSSLLHSPHPRSKSWGCSYLSYSVKNIKGAENFRKEKKKKECCSPS